MASHAAIGGVVESVNRKNKQYEDTQVILDTFPDVATAAEIIVSGVCSPKDLASSKLVITFSEAFASPMVGTKLLGLIISHLESEYKIHEYISPIVEQVLITHGSYVSVVIPENVLDDVINGRTDRMATEGFADTYDANGKLSNLGILGDLGNKMGVAYEAKEPFSFKSNRKPVGGKGFSGTGYQISEEDMTMLVPEITDNFNILKTPHRISLANKKKLGKLLGNRFATESYDRSLFKQVRPDYEPVVMVGGVNTPKRKSVAPPLWMSLPPGSVAPVVLPSDRTKHRGYVVVLDGEGSPITPYSNNRGMGVEVSNTVEGTPQTALDRLVRTARANLTGGGERKITPEGLAMYKTLVTDILTRRIQNGLLGSGAEVVGHDDMYQIMLARALEGKFTRLLFIPPEFVSYFAIKYEPDGTGRSLMAGIHTVASQRAVVQHTRTLAQIKNSINRTKVNLTLDPDDPDPKKTISIATGEVARVRQHLYPLGLLRPEDIGDWVQKAGVEMTFEGHPGLPSTKLEFDNVSSNHIKPDEDLATESRRASILGLMVPPEMVDQVESGELATSVIMSHALLNKRILRIQNTLAPTFKSMIRSLIAFTPELVDSIIEVLKDNIEIIKRGVSEDVIKLLETSPEEFYEEMVLVVLDSLVVSLPKPDGASNEALFVELKSYIEALDVALNDGYLPDAVFDTSSMGDSPLSASAMRDIIKAHFIRQWLSNNNFMPELANLTSTLEDGKPAMNIREAMSDHAKALAAAGVSYIKGLEPVKEAVKVDLAETEPSDGGSDTTTDTTSEDEVSDDPVDTDIDTGEEEDSLGEPPEPPDL
jgi:hypothetical protein